MIYYENIMNVALLFFGKLVGFPILVFLALSSDFFWEIGVGFLVLMFLASIIDNWDQNDVLTIYPIVYK